MNLDEQKFYLDKIVDLILNYGPKLLLAILTLIVGSWAIKLVAKIAQKSLDRINFEPTLKPYLLGVGQTLLRVVLYVSVIGMLGIQTTSFVAVLGAAGLAVGMALQGSLSNFAGSVLLLLFKPIKKGDFIEAAGVSGVVDSIQPFVTVVLSTDNVVYYIPNAALASGLIRNYSVHPDRRVDMQFTVPHTLGMDGARKMFLDVMKSCPMIHTHREPQILVESFADTTVTFAVRPYCLQANYSQVKSYMHEHVKNALDAFTAGK